MLNRALGCACAGLLAAAAPPAARSAPAAGEPAVESALTAAEVDPALILPPPPQAGSAQSRRELAELREIERTRSAGDIAAATSDSDTEDASIFAEAVGTQFALSRLPATAHMFAIVRATEKAAAKRGKAEFRRPRPWIVDPALHSCSRNDDALSSYPSGHTTMAFSMAAILTRLVPDKAPAIMARAARYGESRLICEVHFRSDVTAGEALGLIVAERLMAKPAFQQVFATARAELREAGIAR